MKQEIMQKETTTAPALTTAACKTAARATAAPVIAALTTIDVPERTGRQAKALRQGGAPTAACVPELLIGEPSDGESHKAIQACNDYLRMGSGRSLSRLVGAYHDQAVRDQAARQNMAMVARAGEATASSGNHCDDESAAHECDHQACGPQECDDQACGDPRCTDQTCTDQQKRTSEADKCTNTHQNAPIFSSSKPSVVQPLPPTFSLDTLKKWSTAYDWAGRACEYDKYRDEEKCAKLAEVRDTGFGLDYVRIEGLKQIAALLEREILQTDAEGRYCSLWLSKSGESGDYETFNAPIIQAFRGLLDDIAKETGERRKNHHLVRVLAKVEKNLDWSTLSNAQVDRIRRGEHWILVLLSPYFRE